MFVNSKNFSHLMLALTLALLLPALTLAQQSKQRVVTLKPYKDQPVEITATKVKGVHVMPKRKFAGDKDWLLGMTITLKNISDRPIAFASVLVSTYYEKNGKRIKIDGKETQAAIQLMFGERPPGSGESALPYYIAPLPPGHSVDALLSERSRDELYSLINGHEAETDVTEITIRIYQVFFEGDSDTMWSTGRMLRRDRNDPQLWTPIHAPSAL